MRRIILLSCVVGSVDMSEGMEEVPYIVERIDFEEPRHLTGMSLFICA